MSGSEIPEFRNLSPDDRRAALVVKTELTQEDSAILSGRDILPLDLANGMIENVIGKFEIPLGVATNFRVNGKDYLVPMAVEEPSVVAAASYMAKLARVDGGFVADADDPIMRAQIQVLGVTDVDAAKDAILADKKSLIELANSKDAVLISLGGGCKDIEVHTFETSPVGPMVVAHLLVDVRDAMGANTVNTMAELLAPRVAALAGGQSRLRILSNLADRRLVRAKVTVSADTLSTDTLDGADVAQGIVEACALALIDPYRAATHNKGIMNGIDPVVVATGNDWRAIEAGAHAFAAQSGRYTSLTKWEIDVENNLVGSIELPMALGLVGGATKTHPAAQAGLKVLNVGSARELAMLVASVGLAQNMAALRALATEGIQKGHMALHARNIAIVAGAEGADIERVAAAIVTTGDVSVDAAKRILDQA
ncbi:hydroxymethylglutaryl-CoA reductase, degradative [Amylibacter sp. IMCC11727]|uniref:hydroxymethylglutaryl-CoA reductase, degradative n=1 Tax=Amylibacter sp. IMCC11727 TaxID=3039851 RepID=UPI00244DCB86|nr:hydroxymethylglutaryl-CoA reductase, degradative [Amylibacter sp. IMCC11727]WGI21583.1 hydroxymethylglutaryl-CoA reductase, degradative [Amylibacter sp. IMCC11727]